MTTPNSNPFVFPGLGQPSDEGQNPMLASMEMMRQAWQNLAQVNETSGAGLATPPMSVEELDRRIAELRVVENWLRMNLSMLGNTIQGLEVQRATIATLKSFVSSDAATSDGDNPSALEVALGLKPSGQAKIKPAADRPKKQAQSRSGTASPDADAGQAWWSMLQDQFNTLASATAAAMPPMEQTQANATSSKDSKSAMPASPAPKRTAARKTATRKRTVAKKKAGL